MGKIVMTIDGNTAAAYVAYAFTDVAAIYPITPSSTMAEVVDEWAAMGRKNIFNQTVHVVEMQSEGGAAGTFHGSLQAGALTTTFTASQGLLLMIPNMYKVAGELLPGVFHVSARALAAQALNIFGDHQDVMAVRQTGCAMLATGSVQEVLDLAPVAHLAAIQSRIPFVHFFDGFRTSHEIQKVEALDYDEYKALVDKKALKAFRDRALSPNHPCIRGTAQNPDIYFQTREASNKFYDELIPIVENYINKMNTLTGRSYGLFDYYGADNAEYLIVAMGSVTATIEQTVDRLNEQGKKYGVIKVHLYRPFSKEHLLSAVPATTKGICVLDRTKEPGSLGEPLYLDVCAAFYGNENAPLIVGGRYGLGSKDTVPSQIKAAFDNLESPNPKNHFTLGINDDVTHTSLSYKDTFKIQEEGTVRCKFWGLGSDGTVGANKQAIKIIGNHTDKYVQAYFAYDSKKSGGVTLSHLRFGDHPIRSPYLIDEADYIACHNQAYINQYDVLKGIKDGGTFVLNCIWDTEALEAKLPDKMKKYLAEHHIAFYSINATKIAMEIGLGNRINMIMQAAFFKLAHIINEEEAKAYLKEAIQKAYGKKGEKIVYMNNLAVDRGFEAVTRIEVKEEWKELQPQPSKTIDEPSFIKHILRPMNAQEGDELPISLFNGIEDGTFPSGTAAYEKRGIAVEVPEWQSGNCIQCNQCAFICPHATIRPVLLNKEEEKSAPKSFTTLKATGKDLTDFKYRMQVSPLDCTGCGNCVTICPAPKKALIMKPLNSQLKEETANWDYAINKVQSKDKLTLTTNVKNSQFKTPLIEFSGACAGCGEPAYMKVITQLLGDRMMIANATGCSSIWGGSAPSVPYTKNSEGKGPCWANSLFEDNAEYGLGMYLGVKQMRDRIELLMNELLKYDIGEENKKVIEDWIVYKEVGEASKVASNNVMKLLEEQTFENDAVKKLCQQILELKDYLIKRSVWLVGGDGWSYDIGYGGLDHVVATGEDINVLIFDTEVYSNTGGQSSKATPIAAIAKFAASGKKTNKKDLGRMLMTYKDVYVAQVAMGADKNQFLKAVLEAESYKGPSIIIAYAPCINHGIKDGMSTTVINESKAVKCGYWHLYRYNPEQEKPFRLDSPKPTESFKEFIMNQVRYASLFKQFPKEAEELFNLAEANAKRRYEVYKMMSEEEQKKEMKE